MKKLRKLSALLVLSLIIPGYIQGATNNTNKENTTSVKTVSYSSINEAKSIASVTETNETLTLLDSARKRHYSIYAGYTGSFKNSSRDVEKNNKYNHIIELGAAYTNQLPSKLGYSIYAGTDIVFNSEHFLVGPKVGANLNYSIVMIGSEMIVYTDATYARLYYRPYVGLGVGPLKITGGYNIGVGNKGTFKHDINSFTVGVTIPLFWGN